MAWVRLVSRFVAFCFFGVLLTSSTLFAAVIVSIQLFCECMHVRDASLLFLESSWDFLIRSARNPLAPIGPMQTWQEAAAQQSLSKVDI